MNGASRSPKLSEETFRLEVWGMLTHVVSLMWYVGGGNRSLAPDLVEYINKIRNSLAKVEEQVRTENDL